MASTNEQCFKDLETKYISYRTEVENVLQSVQN